MRHLTMSISRAATLVTLLLAMIVVGHVDTAHAEDFIIEDFHSDIIVSANGKVYVKETIVVDFSVSRHGIYREIPFRYVSDMGDKILMPITVTAVTRENGDAWEYRVRYHGDVVNVRIGDADRYVHGRQVYVIDYTVENAIRFFEDHDELYWNVTGNYWLARMRLASADVHLNTAQPSSKLTGACYTGRYGSDETACDFEISANEVSFSANRTLRGGEGLTIAVGWDKGLVAAPTEWQQFIWGIQADGNWVFVIPALVLIFVLFHWYRRGRDPRVRVAVTVMYEPPSVDGRPLTAAQAGVMIDERLDQRDVTASLIGLAAKGYIELRETHEDEADLSSAKDYTVIKLKEPDDELSHFESALMAEVFAGESSEVRASEMKNKFYSKLPELRRIIFAELVDKKFFAANPLKVIGRYAAIGFATMIVVGLTLYLLSPYNHWRGLVAGALSGVVIIAFARAMPVKTRRGASVHVHILGFQEFMNRAEKDRMERMGEQIFYKYLPYAIALDVVHHWVKVFEGILKAPPSWFVPMSTGGAFNARLFGNSLTGAATHLGSTMFSAPRGSGLSGGGGSGGGGSSGGGGGGGGGGSW